MAKITRLNVLLPAFLSLVLGVTSTPTFFPGCLAQGSGSSGQVPVGKAIYYITNEDANAVVALPIAADGTLSNGTVTATGGAGSVANDATGNPATPDGMLSQAALAVAGNYLFAVNAGSNTVSMFAISRRDPTKLTLVSQPAAVPGDFPNTVAASLKNSLVCASTTGVRSGVSCASFSPETGIGAMDALRPFNLGQTTPPVGPPNTVSQSFFSADESMLLTTVKGDPANANKTGFLSAFPVMAGLAGRHNRGNGKGRSAAAVATLSTTGIQSVPNGTNLLFGAKLVPGSPTNLVVADPAFGAAILSVDPTTGEASTVARQTIDGQVAVCWVAISSATNTAFISDAGFDRLIEVSMQDASILSTLDLTDTFGDQGIIDMEAAGGYLYGLSPNNGTVDARIAVIKAAGGGQPTTAVQHFDLAGLSGTRSQGMAVLL